MTQLSDNIAKLPEICFGVHRESGELILLKRGETGYWRTEGYRLGPFAEFHQLADFLNDRRGITKAQRAAMEQGSCFGFDLPIADPALHEARGA